MNCIDPNCKSCQDEDLHCLDCTEGFYLGNQAHPITGKPCLRKCSAGPFTDPLALNYENERKLKYEALSQANTCVNCGGTCQRCANITLDCEDKIIDFEIKESVLATAAHELLFEVVFAEQNKEKF